MIADNYLLKIVTGIIVIISFMGVATGAPANVNINDQQSEGSEVVVSEVTFESEENYFIVIHNGTGRHGNILGNSSELTQNTTSDIVINLFRDISNTRNVTAVIYESGDEPGFNIIDDVPHTHNGSPIMDTARITVSGSEGSNGTGQMQEDEENGEMTENETKENNTNQGTGQQSQPGLTAITALIAILTIYKIKSILDKDA